MYSNTFKNQILCAYYPNITTLYEFLTTHCGSQIELIQKSDEEEYTSLLKTSLINDNEQSFQRSLCLWNSEKQYAEVVKDAITELVNKKPDSVRKKQPNVLSLGFRWIPFEYGHTVKCKNSCTGYIEHLPALKKLYSRLGEKAMTYLLTNTSIFIFLSNNSYLQVTGPAISELPNPNIDCSSKVQMISQEVSEKMPSQEIFEGVSSQETFKRKGTFERVLSQKTFVEMAPQGTCVNLQRESKNFIPDLENLNDSPKVTPQKRALDDPYSQYEEISKSTKYNNCDGVRYFRKSNTIRTDVSENSSLNKAKTSNEMSGDREINSKRGIQDIFPSATHGSVRFGLPKCHILNITKMSRDVIQHIFPKQFGLQNVFDHDENGQPSVQSLFQPYQNRITEIQKLNTDIPPRLIRVLPMIDQIISRHKKCGYTSLLKRYCPVMMQSKLSALSTDDSSYIQDVNSSSNKYQVTTFVREVLRRVIPEEFWGCNDNQQIIFEGLSLHHVLNKFKIKQCKWLFVDGNKNNKVEADKRSELLYEFIWWIFDCFVIPLLQTNFYITTNAKYKNLVFYYRKDIWLRIEKYNMESLPANTFEEVPKETEKQFLDNSILGYCTARFLPKGLKGEMRRVINLNRVQSKVSILLVEVDGEKNPKRSVNTILQDTFQVLTFEKDMQLSDEKFSRLDGSVFNLNEIYERLKEFKQNLTKNRQMQSTLYFAKVDVQCCFESIDQEQVLDIVKDVLKESEYAIHKYDVVCQKSNKIHSFYKYYINSKDNIPDFPTFARESAQKLPNSVFIDRVKESYLSKKNILDLLEKHIKYNLIKIGDKFYRQCIGISQGSVVSTLLCSFYYGEMEWKVFPFIKHDDGVNKEKVERFITAMHNGHPKYKCIVNREKSLTNFDVIVNGEPIEKLSNTF
ncbi:1264_t:CDS:10, partial [Dentiscutata erythropus]